MYCTCCHSDEEDGETLDWLPMAPEIEDPEEPGWGQLEVSGYLMNWPYFLKDVRMAMLANIGNILTVNCLRAKCDPVPLTSLIPRHSLLF